MPRYNSDRHDSSEEQESIYQFNKFLERRQGFKNVTGVPEGSKGEIKSNDSRTIHRRDTKS
jgi:hypothetical protein